MTDTQKNLAIHAGCVALIIACVVLDVTLLLPYPLLGKLLIAAATWLWGSLGFTPADPILKKFLAGLEPEKLLAAYNAALAAKQEPPKP